VAKPALKFDFIGKEGASRTKMGQFKENSHVIVFYNDGKYQPHDYSTDASVLSETRVHKIFFDPERAQDYPFDIQMGNLEAEDRLI